MPPLAVRHLLEFPIDGMAAGCSSMLGRHAYKICVGKWVPAKFRICRWKATGGWDWGVVLLIDRIDVEMNSKRHSRSASVATC